MTAATPTAAGAVATSAEPELECLCRSGIPGYAPWRASGARVRFDVRLARRAIGFFHDVLVFVEGERAGQPQYRALDHAGLGLRGRDHGDAGL